MGPTRTPLPGGRWHFAHGPIELVIGTDEAGLELRQAHEAAWVRFQTVLQELVAELPLLRLPVQPGPCPVQGPIARRMWQACAAMPTDFLTPMAAVAGAVAQEILAPYAQAGLQRAYVNNGGDIALHMAPGAQWRVGLVADIARRRAALDGMIDWNRDGVEATLRRTAEVLDAKLKDVIRPFYIAITGSAQGVPLFDAITHLGRDIIRERLRHAMELLGPATSKEMKAWTVLLTAPPKAE